MATIKDEKTSLLDSAIGPVSVTTTKYEDFSIDDYVSLSVQSKADNLRLLNKARAANPLEAKNRDPVRLEDVTVGGFDGV